MRTPAPLTLSTLAFMLAACGVETGADPTHSRDDRLRPQPVVLCEGLTETQCAANVTECESVWSSGICPLGCPVAAGGSVNCPPCAPAGFVECRTRCELLDELSCGARADCTATWANTPCPLSACRDPNDCPQCKPAYTGCVSGGTRSGGGEVGSSLGVADAGSTTPGPR